MISVNISRRHSASSSSAPDTSPGPKRAGVLRLLPLLVVVTAGPIACNSRDNHDARSGDTEIEARGGHAQHGRLTIAFSAGLKGRIEPCACTERHLGGLARRATALEDLADHADRTIRIEVGSLAAGGLEWHAVNYEYVARGLVMADYTAVNLGRSDLQLAPQRLQAIVDSTGLPLISLNARSRAGSLHAQGFRAVNLLGRRIAIVGLVQPPVVEVHPDWEIADPESSLTQWLATLHERFDHIVVVADATEKFLERLGERFPEVDLVLGGDVAQASAGLIGDGPTRIAYCAARGQVLGAVQWTFPPDGSSPPSAEVTMVQLDDSIAEHAGHLLNVEAYNNELAEITRVSGAASLGLVRYSRNAPTNAYVGSRQCVACHIDAAESWAQSAHASALDALQSINRGANPDCLRCHTVGLGVDSGFLSQRETPHLAHVGCESCHGPGRNHVQQQTGLATRGSPRFRSMSAQICGQCHDPENSPEFDFAIYWQQIIHGLDTGVVDDEQDEQGKPDTDG